MPVVAKEGSDSSNKKGGVWTDKGCDNDIRLKIMGLGGLGFRV